MESGTIGLIAAAMGAGAFVQGLSGLGFALVSAPVVSQLVPGSGGIGVVNAFSLVQNAWLLFRIDAPVAWREVRRMLPGLAAGILLGWAVLRVSDPRGYRVVVAASATASIAWLLLADRFRGRAAGIVSAVWGAAVNTVAGVGGPPLAAYLVTRGLSTGTYIRTLQLLFAGLSLISLPMLGVDVPSVWAAVAWASAIVLGSTAGELLRRHIAEATASRVARAAIVVVCVVALVLALADLRA